jgi:integrase/recombinase XerD
LKRFFPEKETIFFEDINYRFLKSLEAKYKSKNESVKGLNIHLRTIRAIINRAIKEGKVKKESNPFSDYSIKKAESHIHAISMTDIIKIEGHKFENEPNLQFAKDLFLFSFYCMGMNFTDIAKLKMKNIDDKRIRYQRAKTRRDYSIKITPKIKGILDVYTKDKKPDAYVFPILRGTRLIDADEITDERNLFNRRLKRLGKICEVSKPLHSYLSRHAWANIAKSMNMPLTLISEGLGHTSITTTQTYLDRFDDNVLDDANELITGDVPKDLGIDLRHATLK